jgi:hypothetical protein
MKTKLLSLAVAVLGTAILAHAVTLPIPPDGFCAHAPQLVRDVANFWLALLGLPTC